MGVYRTFNQEIEKVSLGHDATRCAVVQITVTVEFDKPMTAVGIIGGLVMEVARGIGSDWPPPMKSNLEGKVCVHVEGIDVFGANGAFIASEKELNEVFDGQFGRPVWGPNSVIGGRLWSVQPKPGQRRERGPGRAPGRRFGRRAR